MVFKPRLPTAAAMIAEGITPIKRVTRRRINGYALSA